jgi:hypothetical protein
MKIENSYSLGNISTEGSDSTSITFFEYFYVFLLIIYAGRANTFVESVSIKENFFGVILPIVLSIILAFRWKVVFDAKFYIVMFCFSFYFIAISIKDGEMHPTFLLTYFFKFFTVYTVIKALKFNLFGIYERVTYYLAITGLILWGMQVVLGGDTLFDIFNRIPGLRDFSYVTGKGVSVIVYSVQPTSYSILDYKIPRNCGFAQEPGSFSVYLCMAIFVNLFITSSGKDSKKLFWVLVIALISTMSTTGYVIFMVITVYFILSKNLNKVLLLLPIAIGALIYASTLPFMSNKIVELINETNELDLLIVNTIGREETATPQRFTSFMITYRDFKDNPVLGLGPDNEKSWINKVGARISPISGIGNLLAQFGLVGFLFFIISTLSSSIFISKYFEYNGKLLLFIIIILISISYSVIILPLLMSFWMFQIFAPRDRVKNVEDSLILRSANIALSPGE